MSNEQPIPKQQPKPYECQPVFGEEVYHWPEFVAFAKRLGIEWELPTTTLTITLPLGDLVRIAHDYQGRERHLPAPELEAGD